MRKQQSFLENVIDFIFNKMNLLYLATLFLQVTFAILQFVPIVNATLAVHSWYGAITEELSFYGFFSHETQGNVEIIFWVLFGLYALSFITTIKYFLLSGAKRYGRFFGLIFSAVVYLVLCFDMLSLCEETYRDYEQYGAIFEVFAAGKWYLIVGCLLVIVSFILSRLARRQRLEETINARVQNELKKSR